MSMARYLVLALFLALAISSSCQYRCSATSHKQPCWFFRNNCCAVCLCMPPGTYRNKQFCACWKIQEGPPKWT
ncbi:hypothetical protein AMTRI_Chr06g173410 [Amborella trichopoda]